MALVLPVLILMTAFAVDLGRQRASRRTMQARADIVSLDLIRLADGRTESEIMSDPGYAAFVQESADRNEVELAKLTIEWGTWNGTDSIACRLSADPPSATCVPDAVEVTAQETTDYFFQPGSGHVTRTAVATKVPEATFSLGSTLLEANAGNSTLLNPILTGLLCGTTPPSVPNNPLCPHQASFSALSYQGLADANVTLEDLAAAGSFGSVDALLTEDLTVTEFAQLTAVALQSNGDPTNANLYDGAGNSIATLASSSSATFTMQDVLAVDTPADAAAATAELNPFDLLLAGLQVANGSNFIDVATAIPPLSLPGGIANLSLASRYQLVETPVTGQGRVGDPNTMPPIVRTAQVRLLHYLTFDVNLSVLGTGVTGNITLPVDITGGGAEATLTAIDCNQPVSDSTIDVTAAPRPITGTVGTFFDDSTPATIGNLNLTVLGIPMGLVGLSAYGAIDPALQNTGATSLTGIEVGATQSAPGSAFALGGAIASTKLQTAVGGVSSLNVLIGTTLNGLLAALDAAAAPALGALGLSVSSSDVNDLDVECNGVRLAK